MVILTAKFEIFSGEFKFMDDQSYIIKPFNFQKLNATLNFPMDLKYRIYEIKYKVG